MKRPFRRAVLRAAGRCFGRRRAGTASDAGVVLGVGYDGRVGRNFSLTPFFDLVSGAFDGGTVNSARFGLGFSFH